MFIRPQRVREAQARGDSNVLSRMARAANKARRERKEAERKLQENMREAVKLLLEEDMFETAIGRGDHLLREDERPLEFQGVEFE